MPIGDTSCKAAIEPWVEEECFEEKANTGGKHKPRPSFTLLILEDSEDGSVPPSEPRRRCVTRSSQQKEEKVGSTTTALWPEERSA